MKKVKQPSDLLFIHRIFKGIANASIEIFIPIIIYTKILENTGSAQTGLTYAFLFAAIKCFSIACIFLLAKKFMRRYSILSVLISIIPIITEYFLLNFLTIKLYLIFILAILAAASEALYYGGINMIFAVMDKSANSAKFDIGYNIGHILFTLLSAYILGSVKDSLIFVIIFATIMHIISIIPLISNYKELSSIIKHIPKNNQKAVIKDIKFFNFYHYFFGLAYIFMEVALPLYLAYTGLTFTKVGIVLAFGQIVKIISSMLAKYLQNKNKDILGIIISASIFFVSILAIAFLDNPLAIYIFTLAVTFACQALQTIVFVKYVKFGVQTGYIYDSIYYRDFFQNTGRGTTVFIYFLSSMFPVLFGVGIVASVLTGIFGTVAVNDANKKMLFNLTETKNENEIKITETENTAK